MRALLIWALALLLAGCNGDRIKNSMNAPRAQPQTGLPTRTLGPPSAPAERPAEARRKKAIHTASTSMLPKLKGAHGEVSEPLSAVPAREHRANTESSLPVENY
jgi:hypothetical protein